MGGGVQLHPPPPQAPGTPHTVLDAAHEAQDPRDPVLWVRLVVCVGARLWGRIPLIQTLPFICLDRK